MRLDSDSDFGALVGVVAILVLVFGWLLLSMWVADVIVGWLK